ncbi:MAG: META domain-containing protein [Methanoregula sp.]|jgi:heat shock protein HslJ
MKVVYFTCIGLLILAVLVTGCTSQPAQTPVTPAATAVPEQTVSIPATPPATLTSTTWKLGWFDDTRGIWSKVAEGSTITATFLNEGKVTGSGGCNGYSSDYQLGSTPRIWFRRPEVPQNHECQTPYGVMSQESAYFTDLEWAETYSITDGQLLIFDKTNKKILQFDPS